MSDHGPVVLSGRYELHRRIARGGMAEVYLARDQLLERPVAIKILFPEYATDRSFVERFRREAQAAANLNHPSIVGVYDWGKEAGTHFIVMEYVDGRSLSDILRAEGTLHPDRAADVATDVAAALGFAHRNGVVHRDVKPGNVLISSQGVVKVTDFGIARAITQNAEEHLTQTGSVMGTATYFSPEQAQGKAVDPRSDLYSLGVVMYEMVCGRAPFTGDSPVAIAYKHVQETVPPLHRSNAEVPAAYEAVTMKLLAKNPANRYPSAEDLRADLRRFREGQPVLAEGVLDPPVGAAAGTLGATRAMGATGNGPATATGTAVLPPSEDEPEGPRRRTGWYIAIVLALLALLGGLLFLFAKQLGIGGGSDQVTVPEVVGVNSLEAQGILRANDLEVRIQNQPSETVAENDVIASKPPAGEEVDKGTTVTLVVSSGPRPIAVPDVTGQPQLQAIATLVDAGFTREAITVQTEKSDAVDDGSVIRTDPPAGQPASPTGPLVLYVSSGAKSVVPNVIGSTEAAARRDLTAAGCGGVEVTRRTSGQPVGTVIGLSPRPGSPCADTTVTVALSSGRPTTTTTAPTTTTSSTTTSSTTTSSTTTTTAPPTSSSTTTPTAPTPPGP